MAASPDPAREDPVYDVAVLGSGVAGAILAMILARHGFSVLMLEAGSHPRFAIGESVVPEFGALARVLAERFDVPELAHLSTFQGIRHHVSASCGIKKNFSFLHHTDAQEPRRDDWCQFQTMTTPLGPDTHVYRPDLDAWLTAFAVRYGATYRERTRVDDVALEADGVRLQAGETTFRARFLADGSGHRSLVATKLGLRKEVDLGTDSRSIFTHMVGVKGLGEALAGGPCPLPSDPDQGTLHHLFDGGWFWVIPFDNHALAVNPVCSVGLTLDRRQHPDNDEEAEAEFFRFVERFPVVRRQLQGARAVRSWIKTGRIQYQSTRLAGDRWCLLPHSAGFLDALFSGGLVLTLLGTQEVATALMDGLREDDLRAERFAAYEEGSQDNLATLDKVVHGAYLAFRSRDLFNAWYRVWAVGNYHGSAAFIRLHMKYLETRDPKVLDLVRTAPYRRTLGTDQPRVRALIDEGYRILTAVDRGEVAEGDGVERLFQLLGRQDWVPPQFQIARRERRHLASFTVLPLLAMILWGKRRAPEDMRPVYYDVGPVFFWELTKALGREAWRGLRTTWRVFAAAHWTRGRS